MAQYLGAGVFVPENDKPHREYLEECAKGKLPLQQCTDCNRMRYPVRTHCPDCRSTGYRWQPVSGKGTIYSYYVVPHPINPAFRNFVPYPVALIELDDARGEYGEHRAFRIIGNVLGADGNPEKRENMAIGKRVEVTFIDLGDGWALPQWRLSNEPPESTPWQIPHTHPPQ
jgi:uncharacterized OB-fold protein